MEALTDLVADRELLLDPFAGTGRVHELGRPSWGIEIEPEWAALHPRTLVGNALELPFRDHSFDCVVTSPAYGNRMADHHEARDDSKRNTYRHTLGRRLNQFNSGGIQWGDYYRFFHVAAWTEVRRVLKPGELFLMNISDHIRKGKVVPVSEWHREAVEALGFKTIGEQRIRTRRQKQGANGNLRVDHEMIWLFAAPGAKEREGVLWRS